MPPIAQRIIAVIVATAGVFFALMGVRMWRRADALVSTGVVVVAQLTEVHPRSDSDTGVVGNYAFTVGGERFTHLGVFGETPTSITPEEAANPGGVIAVRYLPEDPSVNMPASSETSSKHFVAIVVGLGLIVAGIVRWLMSRAPA
jgi:hypothetical protein